MSSKAQALANSEVPAPFLTLPLEPAHGWKEGTLRMPLSREGLVRGRGLETAVTEVPRPTPPRAQVRPLVKVLLPHVAAIQHKDIEDVDGTDLPLGLPLERQVHCPPCQAPTPPTTGLTAGEGKGREGCQTQGISFASLPDDSQPRLAGLLSTQRAEAQSSEAATMVLHHCQPLPRLS